MPTFPTADARLEWVRTMLATNEKWALHALLDTFRRQTADEQAAETTTDHNGVGFGSRDSEILSSFAKQVLNWQQHPAARKFPAPLSAKQLGLVHRLMPKYAKQLITAHTDRFDHDYPVVKAPKAGTSNTPVAPAKPDQAVQAARDAVQRAHDKAEHAAMAAQERAEDHRVAEFKLQRDRAFNPDTATF